MEYAEVKSCIPSAQGGLYWEDGMVVELTRRKKRKGLVSSLDKSGRIVAIENRELVVFFENHVDERPLWRHNKMPWVTADIQSLEFDHTVC